MLWPISFLSHSFNLRAQSWPYSWFQVSLILSNKLDHPDAVFNAFSFPLVICSINLFNCIITLLKLSGSVDFFWSSLSFSNVNVLNEKTLFWGKERTISDIFSSWMKQSFRHGEITNVTRGQTSLGHTWKGRRKFRIWAMGHSICSCQTSKFSKEFSNVLQTLHDQIF